MLYWFRSLVRRLRPVGWLIVVEAAVAGFATYSSGWVQTSPFPLISKEERLRRPGWWPTKGTAAREEYVGPTVCARCHPSIVTSQARHNSGTNVKQASESCHSSRRDRVSLSFGFVPVPNTQSPEGRIFCCPMATTRSPTV
jgi:hypothetical protein